MTVAETWHDDILGPGFQALDIPLGPDPEGEGEVQATLVRYLPEGLDAADDEWTGRSAVMWVPGMTDYFFHSHVAKDLHEAGTAVYAVDLRKIGRARMEGQRWHFSLDFAHYFPDLTAALDIITETHPDVTPIAHSTGGLIAPLWADHLARNDSARHAKLKGIVLNSPWLDMQYPRPLVRIGRPIINVAGRLLPNLEVPGGNLGTYGVSLHKDHFGEWDFDTELKPVGGHRKYLGWLREVLRRQKQVQEGEVDVAVPVLTLCSTHSLLGAGYSPASNSADTVLDIEQIKRWAPELGENVTVRPIEGARHDVFLSTPTPLAEALDVTKGWLRKL